DGNPLAKTERVRPFARQPTGRAIGWIGMVVQAVAQGRQLRVEPGQEIDRRQPAPRLREHGFVTGCADAPLNAGWRSDAAQHRWDEICELDPARRGVEDLRRDRE